MIEKLLAWMNSLPPDKVAHFASGVILFAVCYPFMGAKYAMTVVIVAGFLKEIYDTIYKEKHTADIFDALATCAGGAVAYTLTI